MSASFRNEWLERVSTRVNAHLEELLTQKRADARTLSPHAEELVIAVSDLTMRGGKRLRPATVYAAVHAVGGASSLGSDGWLALAAALELLQTYFLIQDDWMDGDEQRRGGPSVHAAFAKHHKNPELGAHLAILAADFASGLCWELLSQTPFPERRSREALAAFGRMHTEVVYGQQLDLLGYANVALVHQLKTGSYTVRGPLLLGALLGDATPEQLSALARYGAPLGLAFQLRDDLLGAFGDRATVGKPVRIDLRAGKHTALIAEVRALLDGREREDFERAFGDATASDESVARAHEVLERSGARERLEQRVAELREAACSALSNAAFRSEGVAMLNELASRLTQRQH